METVQFVMQYNAKINANKNLTEEEKIGTIANMLNVKTYIPIREKENIVKSIIKNTTQYSDGKLFYNSFEKDLYTIITLIKAYTDLNLDEKGYDMLCANNITEYLLSSFGKEYKICVGLIDTFLFDIEEHRLSWEDL